MDCNENNHRNRRRQSPERKENQENWNCSRLLHEFDRIKGHECVKADVESGESCQEVSPVFKFESRKFCRKSDGDERQQDCRHSDGQVSDVEDGTIFVVGVRSEEGHERLNEGQDVGRHADGRVAVFFDACPAQGFDSLFDPHQDQGGQRQGPS